MRLSGRLFMEYLGLVPAQQIKKGMNEGQNRATWQADLEKYRAMRSKYLLHE